MSHQEFWKVVMSQLHSRHPQPRPQLGHGGINNGRADDEARWAVPAQACESWPIRVDWAFWDGTLKKRGINTVRSIQANDE